MCKLMTFEFSFLLLTIAIAISVRCCQLVSIIFVMATCLIFLCLDQWQSIIRQVRRQSLFVINRFNRRHTRLLVTVLSFNSQFGIVFLLFLIICFAMTLVELMSLLFSSTPMSRHQQMIVYFMAAQQFLFIFGVHFICTRYTSKLHQCSKILIEKFHQRQTAKLAFKLKLSLYIEKFHTKNRYGFTYGHIGLMDFLSFFKVTAVNLFFPLPSNHKFPLQFIMIYVRFTIIAYKLFNLI